MADTLERILETKREHVAAAKARWPRASLEAELGDDETRDFEGALAEDIEDNGLALIAEIKQASPSKGLIRADFDPASLARAYEAGGASCLSVLTDRPYFQGDDEHLKQARAACALPVLRKDFIVDTWQVMESRVIGADAILVILAAIDDDGLALDLVMEARDLDMAALVEVHDETEMDRALALPSPLIGINNRNLKTLEIDLTTTERLAPKVTPDRLLVCESGLYTHADLQRMLAAGPEAFLVGESLLREADVTAATRRLLGREAEA